jgi:hypothetical protein
LIRRQILGDGGEILFALLRCAFLFPDDQNLKGHIAVLFVLLVTILQISFRRIFLNIVLNF